MSFFSVIIPLYNKESYIGKTLNCVMNQSFSDFEVIIVNDGSTDGSVDIVKQINDGRIRLFHQENQGVSVARNKGMELAESDYFCFLDADDEWTGNYLENLFTTIEKFPGAGMYCSRYKTRIGTEKYTHCNLIDIPESYEGYIKDFFRSSFVNRVAHTSAVTINKKTFLSLGGFDKEASNGEDLDYWIRIALRYPVVICKDITVVYNFLHNKESLSRTKYHHKRFSDLEKFSEEEKKNISLKKILDLYRIEYALHFHIVGNKTKKVALLREVNPENIIPKVKYLLSMPPKVLRILLFIKRYLKRFGIDFNIYH